MKIQFVRISLLFTIYLHLFTGTAFTVIWENVYLQEKEEHGKFSFSTTLHKNGDIVFVYYSVPVIITSIQDDKHPVKVGLSDAYIIDKVVYGKLF